MAVNNLGSAFMLLGACGYLTWFLLRDPLKDPLGLLVSSVLGWSLQPLGVSAVLFLF